MKMEHYHLRITPPLTLTSLNEAIVGDLIELCLIDICQIVRHKMDPDIKLN